jgi:hypothetical protein
MGSSTISPSERLVRRVYDDIPSSSLGNRVGLGVGTHAITVVKLPDVHAVLAEYFGKLGFLGSGHPISCPRKSDNHG